ncbi:MAG: D-xylose 1-dehydrogenase Gfo6 [Halodesulfurarchaeum sp.]
MDAPLLDEFEYRDWAADARGTVELALVGLGWWTREYVIPAIERTDACVATTVVSGSSEKRERAMAEHETIHNGVDYEDFQRGDVADAYDAVYICTPNGTHLEHVQAAASQGKDVLVEKPMEATVERAQELVAAADDAEITLMVAYRMHTEPLVRYARQLIRDGIIGDPVLVHGENSQVLMDVIEDPDQWRLDPDLSGYGTSVMDLGIYPLNTTRFLLDADPVAVQSMMGSDRAAFEDVPDQVATFAVEYDGGTRAAFSASQHASSQSRLEIVGDRGRIALEPAFHMETDLRVETEGVTVDVDLPQVDQMAEEFAYFADAILDGGPVYPDGQHGLLDMHALKAIYDAAERGARVSVPTVDSG